MTALLAVLAVAVWAVGFVPTLRWQFARRRPFTEPLACMFPLMCARTSHSWICYQRPGTLISSSGEALFFATIAGLVWPVFWTVIAARAALRRLATSLLTGLIRQTPEEVAAKTARLERDLGMKP